ncbi:MAG: phosphatase PAP2 family protein, partial [Candidatus Cloacimonetes bacterium]|nr:phosphatase PAP2 family protein [Candidatus Cloacimonadota bacterium]
MIRKKSSSLLLNRDFLLPVLILTLSTVTFLIFDLDLLIQRLFYDQAEGWFLKDAQPWKVIYQFGNFPALILAAGGLILLALGLQKTSLARYRKICLYLILVMALGPGLVINTILKENWGRPRPRNITEFGGKYNHERILQIDPGSPGKSFPCGHASMGFYFFVLYFVLRKRKQTLARGFLVLALLWGSLIGLTRILQGGHYASDVIWTGGIMYLSAAGLFYLLKMERDIYFHASGSQSRRWKLIRFSAGMAIILLILLVLLATPHSQQKIFLPPAGWQDSTSYLQGNFRLDSADLEIRFGGGLE